MNLFIGCYIEKWYEIWQKIKHEDATFTLFKIFLWFFSRTARVIKKHKNLNLHLGGVSIACTSVLVSSVWIGIQEHEQNLENEYCAGPVNVYKCMSSAGMITYSMRVNLSTKHIWGHQEPDPFHTQNCISVNPCTCCFKSPPCEQNFLLSLDFRW